MISLKHNQLMNSDKKDEHVNYALGMLVILLICLAIPAYSQFADLPTDAKTVDFGFSGDGASQTLSLTAVLPFKNINGWGGIFGSRASGDEGVLSEIVKVHTRWYAD